MSDQMVLYLCVCMCVYSIARERGREEGCRGMRSFSHIRDANRRILDPKSVSNALY